MSQWHCIVQGQQYGPVSEEDFRNWVIQGRLTANDMVWTEGMAAWQPASQVPALASVLSSAPPPMQSFNREQAPGAVVALVCGIAGLMFGCVGVVLGVIAIKQARKGMDCIRQTPGRYTGEGMCTAGRILGIIATVLGSLWLVYVLFWLVMFVGFGFAGMGL
ncbi:MAG: DUF4339 domain-containing protein [Planctomycetes bacterium]|jgi:hypothetical protein|nr:DUF4339 domain-containing protein [Planctomycetota bacterium]